MTNVAYIGWYVYKGVVVSKEAHEPIVGYDLFMYAFSRLSPTTLDGEPNENKPKLDRRYVSVPALMDGVLESDGTPVYAMAHTKTYVARAYEGSWKSTELVVGIETLDTIVSQAILMVISALEQRHRKGLQDSMYEQLTALQQVKAAETKDFKKQLADVDKGIRQAEMEKRIALKEEYEPGVTAAIKQLKRLHEAKSAIEEKKKQSEKEESEIVETRNLLAEVVVKWNKMPFDRKQRFIRLMVLRANLTEATPHFLKIELDLREPLDCTLIGHVYRARGSKPPWSDDENGKLRELYPQADRKDVLTALPTRTWEAIIQQAGILGIKRTTRLNTSGMPDNMTCADIALCEELDRPWPWQSPVYWEIPQPISEALHSALADQTLKISDLIRLRIGRLDADKRQKLGSNQH